MPRGAVPYIVPHLGGFLAGSHDLVLASEARVTPEEDLPGDLRGL